MALTAAALLLLAGGPAFAQAEAPAKPAATKPAAKATPAKATPAKTEAKPEAKPAAKAEAKPVAKAEAKPAAKAEAKPATKTDGKTAAAKPAAAKTAPAKTAAVKPPAKPGPTRIAAPPPEGSVARAPATRATIPDNLRDEYVAAFDAARAGNWAQALKVADSQKHKLASKVLLWRYYTSPQTPAGAGDLVRFLEDNPDWPRLVPLRRNLERSLDLQGPEADALVMDLMKRYPPVSPIGEARLGEAMLRWGDKEQGMALLRRAWIDGNFGAERERDLWVRYQNQLTVGDNNRRLDRLLWDRDVAGIQRMMVRVDPGRQALANARMALAQQAGNVDTLIGKVPADLQNDPGLNYERARWRRAKNQDDAARVILLSQPGDAARPGPWWTERRIQSRRALREGLVSDAYKMASGHALAEGGDFAEAEWLSGWIALRFLNEPAVALNHFSRLYNAVQFPVSRSRAAYWAGRAAAEMKDDALTKQWYGDAARFPTTFYGQLALQALDEAAPLPRLADPRPEPQEVTEFNQRETTRAVRLIAELDSIKAVDPFLLHLADIAKTDAERLQVAQIARGLGRNDLAVMVSKRASRAGTELMAAGYPVIDLPRQYADEPWLVLALSRQESQFDPGAVSPVGARGLMQLMPETASRTAKSINLPFAVDRLTRDPEYNLMLGSAHVQDLMGGYNGSYVLTLVAYNAGPGRVRQWIEQFGDPRWPEVDAVDWVEMIPFDETRNYVQRVMEAMAVYRQRLAGDTPVRLTLKQDLKR